MIIDSDDDEEEEMGTVGGGDGVRGVRSEGGGEVGDEEGEKGEEMDTSTCDSDKKKVGASEEVHDVGTCTRTCK